MAPIGRLALLITHELDGLDAVDEIVVLDHGRVAERGTHAELIEADGVYHRLWRAGHPADPQADSERPSYDLHLARGLG